MCVNRWPYMLMLFLGVSTFVLLKVCGSDKNLVSNVSTGLHSPSLGSIQMQEQKSICTDPWRWRLRSRRNVGDKALTKTASLSKRKRRIPATPHIVLRSLKNEKNFFLLNLLNKRDSKVIAEKKQKCFRDFLRLFPHGAVRKSIRYNKDPFIFAPTLISVFFCVKELHWFYSEAIWSRLANQSAVNVARAPKHATCQQRRTLRMQSVQGLAPASTLTSLPSTGRCEA